MFLFSTLGRYLMRQTAFGLAIAGAVIVGAIVLVDSVEQLRVFEGEISPLTAFYYSALRLPDIALQTGPFITLFGVMAAYSGLARRIELPVMRASGISAWRFLAPAIGVAAAFGLTLSLAVDPLAALGAARYEAIKRDFLSQRPGAGEAQTGGLWLRQADNASQIVINGVQSRPDYTTLRKVRMFVYERRAGGDYAFARRFDCAAAILKPGFWQLSDVVENAPPRAPLHWATLALPSSLRPDALHDAIAKAGAVDIYALPAFIAQAKKLGYSTDRYRLKFLTLIAQPLLLAAMAMLGGVFSLRMARQGGVGRLIATGIAAGFGFYLVKSLAEALAQSNASPPVLAAFAPPLAAFFAACALIALFEDG